MVIPVLPKVIYYEFDVCCVKNCLTVSELSTSYTDDHIGLLLLFNFFNVDSETEITLLT